MPAFPRAAGFAERVSSAPTVRGAFPPRSMRMYSKGHSRREEGSMNDVMIEAQNLVKRYDGVPAIENVSMQVRRGEVLGFLGPNGAGKSTTMKILTCFTSPSEGSAK